jgi:hypothetical protein
MQVLSSVSLDLYSGDLTLLEQPLASAAPICQLKKPTPEQLSLYQSLTEAQKKNYIEDVKDQVAELISLNKECSSEYAQITKDLEQLQGWISKLQNAEGEIEVAIDKLVQSGESQELPELFKKEMKDALDGASQLKRRLATELRVLNMRKNKQ